ncbi:MAG: PTS cellobiose transporter subunit IIC [Brevinema sp.]
MNILNIFLERYFLPMALKIGANRYLQSIRDGMLFTMPFIMVGSIFLILTNMPIPGFDTAISIVLGESWKELFLLPVRVTFDLMAFFATAGIAYSLSKKYNLDSLVCSMVSIAGFILSTPLTIPYEGGVVQKALSLNYLGSKGLFVGILVALFVTEVFRYVKEKNISINMPEGVPEAVTRSFSALIPTILAIIGIFIFRVLISLTSFDNLHNFLQVIIGKPLSVLGGSLGGLIIGLILQQLLWLVGLHGSSLLLIGLRPSLLQLLDENRLATEMGQEVPNVINLTFYELFVQIGGSGTTFGLALILFFVVRSKQLKELGKLSIGPTLFNINEPISFGLPIIMNPLMFIPWVFAPIITVVIAYFAMSLGFVEKITGVLVPWTMPIILSGFLGTGHISGAVLQVFLVVISGLIYYPFVMLWDKQKLKEEETIKK